MAPPHWAPHPYPHSFYSSGTQPLGLKKEKEKPRLRAAFSNRTQSSSSFWPFPWFFHHDSLFTEKPRPTFPKELGTARLCKPPVP